MSILKKTTLFCFLLLQFFCSENYAQKILFTEDSGKLTSLRIADDKTGMNWLQMTDGSQYEWIGEKHRWGTITTHNGDIAKSVNVNIQNKMDGDDLIQTIKIKNISHTPLDISTLQICTPWNDNYPDARECVNRRCNVHLWPAGNASYVYALRMGGKGPHLGLMLEKGSLSGYAITERDSKKGSSNTRGIINLIPEHYILSPGKTYNISWRIFTHDGEDDFFNKLLAKGGVKVSANSYVGNVGDEITINVESVDGRRSFPVILKKGEQTVDVAYGNKQHTKAELFGITSIDSLLRARARFILSNQQYNKDGSIYDGAFLPYNNEADTIICNWDTDRPRSDMNEGRERVGMGLFLSYYLDYLRNRGQGNTYDARALENGLKRYASFIRTHLQNTDYKTWGDALHRGKHRIYNYPWITHFYCQMYRLTGNRQYLIDAYRTQRAQYKYGGYGFYTIDVPVRQLLAQLRNAGMTEEADTMLSDFRKVADIYVKNGLDFPKFEVNYEQSIVGPCIDFLCQVYQETNDERYLESIKKMMPALEAFNGHQPSCHLNEVAIRHWDGYWFGLPRIWGDTFPHYWSCITADAFMKWAEISGDESYKSRAFTCLDGNLTLFDEEGHGSAAWNYPNWVNSKEAHYANPCGNDQDWALMYYLKYNK